MTDDAKDAARWRNLCRVVDEITVTHGALTITLRPAPKMHVLLNAFVDGAVRCEDEPE